MRINDRQTHIIHDFLPYYNRIMLAAQIEIPITFSISKKVTIWVIQLVCLTGVKKDLKSPWKILFRELLIFPYDWDCSFKIWISKPWSFWKRNKPGNHRNEKLFHEKAEKVRDPRSGISMSIGICEIWNLKYSSFSIRPSFDEV